MVNRRGEWGCNVPPQLQVLDLNSQVQAQESTQSRVRKSNGGAGALPPPKKRNRIDENPLEQGQEGQGTTPKVPLRSKIPRATLERVIEKDMAKNRPKDEVHEAQTSEIQIPEVGRPLGGQQEVTYSQIPEPHLEQEPDNPLEPTQAENPGQVSLNASSKPQAKLGKISSSSRKHITGAEMLKYMKGIESRIADPCPGTSDLVKNHARAENLPQFTSISGEISRGQKKFENLGIMGSILGERVGRRTGLREPEVIKGKAEDLGGIVIEFPKPTSLKRKGQRGLESRENLETDL